MTSAEDDLAPLRSELDALDGFLQLLHRELRQLQADFASVLYVLGGSVQVAREHVQPAPLSREIERTEDPLTGAVVFTYKPR